MNGRSMLPLVLALAGQLMVLPREKALGLWKVDSKQDAPLPISAEGRWPDHGAVSESGSPGPAAPWRLVTQQDRIKIWQSTVGDVISFAQPDLLDLPSFADEDSVRRYCRSFAEEKGAGLVEASVVNSALGRALLFVYKRLDKPAFAFTGVLFIPTGRATWMWTVVSREGSPTGVREALVTAQLVKEGKLTPESYRTSWAQDPYDPAYYGVDRSTLRYVSDDEKYDTQFPCHPLSKVRQYLRTLLSAKTLPKLAGAADQGN